MFCGKFLYKFVSFSLNTHTHKDFTTDLLSYPLDIPQDLVLVSGEVEIPKTTMSSVRLLPESPRGSQNSDSSSFEGVS